MQNYTVRQYTHNNKQQKYKKFIKQNIISY
jgi:hypothetical protein